MSPFDSWAETNINWCVILRFGGCVLYGIIVAEADYLELSKKLFQEKESDLGFRWGWSSDEALWASRNGKKNYTDMHSKARDSIRKETLVEFVSYAYFCLLGILPLFWWFVLNGSLCGYVFVTEEHTGTRPHGFSDFSRPLMYFLWTRACLCYCFPVFTCLLSRPPGRQVI